MFLLGDLVSIGLLLRLGVAALLWVMIHLVIRFHHRGIEIAGVILMGIGLSWWLIQPTLIPPYGPVFLIIGLFIHAVGCGLRWLRHLR
ncbi:MAG: hypothetical protein KJ050_14555 [Candidatus Omnitrophica bacterium]|nr:hypothetical protein [bacterium]MBK7496132.1 hypothetical protein [Candidatus Omnitrophota bacterium]MCE7907455.1 hypothetical protein [Candidatus Omnitrophica bacterium COP1]MBV6483522.1 hypothetical protein [bacterium]MBW7938565.1 hypothetical protein [Candidatus Omnitrophota bacterium]